MNDALCSRPSFCPIPHSNRAESGQDDLGQRRGCDFRRRPGAAESVDSGAQADNGVNVIEHQQLSQAAQDRIRVAPSDSAYAYHDRLKSGIDSAGIGQRFIEGRKVSEQ